MDMLGTSRLVFFFMTHNRPDSILARDDRHQSLGTHAMAEGNNGLKWNGQLCVIPYIKKRYVNCLLCLNS